MKAKPSRKTEASSIGQLSHVGKWSRRFLALALVPLVFLLTGTAVAGVLSWQDSENPSPVSGLTLSQLGSFDLPDLTQPGVRYTNSTLRGRPTVITIFDKSCVSCKTELPMIEVIASEMKNKVFVLGVDHLDRVGDARAFVSGLAITFPVAHELTGDLAVTWQISGLPTTLFVDSEGREVSRVVGTIARDDLINRIERLS